MALRLAVGVAVSLWSVEAPGRLFPVVARMGLRLATRTSPTDYPSTLKNLNRLAAGPIAIALRFAAAPPASTSRRELLL